MSNVVQFPFVSPGFGLPRAKPAEVIILPVVLIERGPDQPPHECGNDPKLNPPAGRRRKRNR